MLAGARDLGKLIATHDAARKFEDILTKLQADTEAQRVLNDFNRALQRLGQKEAQGQPIEVAEKRQLEDLQNKVIRNPLLAKFQMAQMDYLDLMRKVDEAMSGGGPEAAGAEPTLVQPGPRLAQ